MDDVINSQFFADVSKFTDIFVDVSKIGSI